MFANRPWQDFLSSLIGCFLIAYCVDQMSDLGFWHGLTVVVALSVAILFLTDRTRFFKKPDRYRTTITGRRYVNRSNDL